ncbi:MAG: acylphosphatase [Bacteroidetes bacterium]|nr:MAG: acylphosphatase [Bacteroidota bacterium]
MRAFVLSIHGRVQGVFFRKHTKEKALELRLNGTVRNCSDGSVEVHVEGAEPVINEFVQWCHHGPSRAKVTKVDIHESTLKNYTNFVIL